jgi:hypothetical protein
VRSFLVVAGATTLAVAAPFAADRLDGRASPRIGAALDLLELIALAAAPVALLACLAGAGRDPGLHGPFPGSGRVTTWSALVLAAGWGARILWSARSALRATRRARPSELLSSVPTVRWDGIPVHVVPATEPLAFAVGPRRPSVVVSIGLLRILTPEERTAALAHEAAHVRRDHPWLLFVADVLAEALRPLPSAARAQRGLRRHLEAVADDEAVLAVGDPALVLRTIARVGLAGSPVPSGAPLASGDDLRYRIHRLLHPPAPSRAAAAGAGGLFLALLAAAVASLCGGFHPGPLWAAAVACSVALAWVAGRPLAGPTLSGLRPAPTGDARERRPGGLPS